MAAQKIREKELFGLFLETLNKSKDAILTLKLKNFAMTVQKTNKEKLLSPFEKL